MRLSFLLAAVLLAVVAAALGRPEAALPHSGDHPAASQQDPPGKVKEKACKDDYREVKGQGMSCRVAGGLWKVKLRGGETVLTHGSDEGPAATGQKGVFSADAIPRQPVCATSNYFRAILAIPSDITATETATSFRSRIQKADGVLYHAAVESGSPNGAHFRFLCDSAGTVKVDVVRLATPSTRATWSTVTSDLKALGYNKTYEKYVVYYNAKLPGTSSCGQGSIDLNETDDSTNPNNVGPDYAITYNCGTSTVLHEMGHNLGAVQPNAPYTTGTGTNYAHCWESWDVMCYNDGASKDPGYIVNNCPDFDHFDCRHDSYFDAKIGAGQGGGAGSYIDTHWNIGACYVRFVANGGCSGDTSKPTVSAPAQTVSSGSQLGATAIPVRLSWSGSDTGGSGLASYSLWQSTDGGAGAQIALSNKLATSSVRNLEPGHTYQFVTRAFDGAGNASAWAYGPTFSVKAHQETSTAITYTGTWTQHPWSSAYGGYEKTSGQAGATARFAFSGRGVAWVTPTATNRGKAHVYVDGVFQKTVDLYSGSTVARKVVFTKNWDTSGSHTVQVNVVGTSGGPYVDVDAFAVLG